MKTLPAEEMMPPFPVVGEININCRIIPNQGSARNIGLKVRSDGQYSYVLWLVVSVLSFSVFAQATMGAIILTPDAVVMGIDSQISINGKNVRLDCKLRHGGSIAILAAGFYDFPGGVGKYEFWDEVERVLVQPASIEDTAAALDARITPLLKDGLTALYKQDRRHYVRRFGTGIGILEFIVVGVDKQGPSLYRYWYVAKTPSEFKRGGPEKLGAPDVGQINVVPVPVVVNPYLIMGLDFWRITTKDIILASSEKIVEFIHAAKRVPGIGEISDPIATAVITSKGFSFLNKGKCVCK